MIDHDVHAYLDEDGNVVHLIVSDGDLGPAPRVAVETADGESVPLTLERVAMTADHLLDASEVFPHLERAPAPARGLRWKADTPGELRGLGLPRRPMTAPRR